MISNPGMVDPRILVDIKGSRKMSREQAGTWVNPTPAVKVVEDTRVKALTRNQKKVYDAIMAGSPTDALGSVTGLEDSAIGEIVEDLIRSGLLSASTYQDEERMAMDALDRARLASVQEGGEEKYQEARRQAALALTRTGKKGAAQNILGAEGMQGLYGGSNWSYRDLLTARELTGDKSKWPTAGWGAVKEVKAASESYVKDYTKSYGDWYGSLVVPTAKKGVTPPKEQVYGRAATGEELRGQALDYWGKEIVPKW